MITVDGQDGASSDGGSLKLLKPCITQCISSPARRRSIMTTEISDHNASSSMDHTCIRWSGINGKTPDSACSSDNNAPKRRIIDRKPHSGSGGSTRSDRRLQTDKRRYRLPKSYSGRIFQYDSRIVVQPVEIRLHTRNWNNVPRNQRHTRNYHLRFLNSGVRGSDVFSHDKLEYYLKDKKEIL